MRTAISTLAIGEKGERLLSKTRGLMEDYARRCDAEFFVFDQKKINGPHLHFEKAQFVELLDNGFDRVIYLDADVIVRRHAPNLMRITPHGRLGLSITSRYVDRMVNLFNSGVMVICRETVDLFRPPFEILPEMKTRRSHVGDEILWAHRVNNSSIEPFDLGWKHNATTRMKTDKRLAFIRHHTSRGHRSWMGKDANLAIDALNEEIFDFELRHKRDLYVWANLTGRGRGQAVEVGLYNGTNAERILSEWEGDQLITVDPFVPLRHTETLGGANTVEAWDKRHDATTSRLSRYAERYRHIRDTSIRAANQFDDGSLAFAYIDGCHCRACVRSDLLSWIPKIRPGGFIAGHDFGEYVIRNPKRKDVRIEVKGEVEAIAAESRRSLRFIEDDPSPTWIMEIE